MLLCWENRETLWTRLSSRRALYQVDVRLSSFLPNVLLEASLTLTWVWPVWRLRPSAWLCGVSLPHFICAFALISVLTDMRNVQWSLLRSSAVSSIKNNPRLRAFVGPLTCSVVACSLAWSVEWLGKHTAWICPPNMLLLHVILLEAKWSPLTLVYDELLGFHIKA